MQAQAAAAPTDGKPKRGGISADRPLTIAERLIVCREARQISKAEAARALGITAQSMGDLERGKSRQPAADTLLDMEDKLGYNPRYVIRGQGMPLLPHYEDLAMEHSLLMIYRELEPHNKKTLITMAQGVRRAQGPKPSPQDPYPFDPPDD